MKKRYTGRMKPAKLWAPVVFWMAVIFMFSSQERIRVSDIEAVNFAVFKSLHTQEYALLFFLTFRAVKYSLESARLRTWSFWAFVITVCYAATDEIHQTFVPTRGGKASDVIIDAAGALFSWFIIRLFIQKAPKKLRRWVNDLHIV